MNQPIQIDLRTALTDEAVNEALPHIGECYYNAPCIIGALVPKQFRHLLDIHDLDTAISQHVRDGNVEFATERQAEMAEKLQLAFDASNGADTTQFDEALVTVRAELATQVSA